MKAAESNKPDDRTPTLVTAARPKPTGWRKWLFRLLALTLVPTLFVGALELGLRLCGYGYPTGFFLKAQVGGRAVYVENLQFGRRFFPPGLARTPLPLVLPADKPEKTYRIFILGESAAQGFPNSSYGFARVLEVLLRHRYPGTRFEIVNTAMTAINSHVILPIARDCANHKPDLLVVYAGNNEVNGPFGAGNVFGPHSPRLSLIRSSVYVKSLRTGQLLNALARVAVKDNAATPHSWGGMAMFLNNQVRATDSRLTVIYQHFSSNLREICQVGLSAGTKVIVCTVAVNLSGCGPFASLHSPDLTREQVTEWDGHFAEGVRLESAGRFAEAIASYEKAARVDADYAELPIRLGRCLAAAGQHHRALKNYQQACDLDTLRFRADSTINETVRAVAGGRDTEGVYLVDAERAFAQASPGGAPGNDLFFEHVHMNFSGNYLLARTVFDQVARILPADVVSIEATGAEPLTEQQCAARLALTDWNRHRLAISVLQLIDNPPFTNQAYHTDRRALLQQQAQSLRERAKGEQIAAYRKALDLATDDTMLRGNFAELLAEFGEAEQAAEQWNAVLRRAPRDLRAHYALGTMLARVGHLHEATNHFEEVLRINSEYAQAHVALGKIQTLQKNFNKAIAEYAEALRLDPELAEAHRERGNAFALQGKVEDALAAYRDALQINPEYTEAYESMGFVLSSAGRLEEAAQVFSELLRLNPGSAQAHFSLGRALAGQRLYDRAALEFAMAVRLKPDDEAAYINRNATLVELGKLDEAVSLSRAALRDHPELVNLRYSLARALAQQRRTPEAIQELEEVLRRRPDWSEAQRVLQQLRRQQPSNP